MEDLILVLALVAFGAGAVIAGMQKAWALCLVAVGLFLVTIESMKL